jgi:hypothetical protein
MGDAGRRVAKDRFTWPVLAGEVANIYRQLGNLPTTPTL